MTLEIRKATIIDKTSWDTLFTECYYFTLRNSSGTSRLVSIRKRNGTEKVCDMSMVGKRVFIWLNSFSAIFPGTSLDEIFVSTFLGKSSLSFLEV